MTTPAPDWALDLVAAVEYFEDVHPKVEAGRDCLGAALVAIPADVRAEARGWTRAKRALEAPAPAAATKPALCPQCQQPITGWNGDIVQEDWSAGYRQATAMAARYEPCGCTRMVDVRPKTEEV